MATIKNKVIKNFLTKEELSILSKYCHYKLDASNDFPPIIDVQSFSPAWYDDPLMNTFLQKKLPLVEKESNLKLYWTYAYWRYYVFGGTLNKHLDRPSAEISVTTCIKKYDNWPIIVEGKSFELEEGDGLIYSGINEKHWRPGVYKGEGMAQVFFHYIDKQGPYTHHAYDKYFRETGKIK